MNKKSRYLFYIFVTLLVSLSAELIYLSSTKMIDEKLLQKKQQFVALTKLPDLAISTEVSYIRHRSLVGVGAIYKDDGSLREYEPSSYVISHKENR
ncbi:MAG: hypothetical protein U9P72_00870 [Campylobacterota bacterium]|nr:hypothetical protein [Campylobacterota bacterium]